MMNPYERNIMTNQVHDITTAKKTPSNRKRIAMLAGAVTLVTVGFLAVNDRFEVFSREKKNTPKD